METVALICQILIALGIVNVWLLRPGKSTAWRGGGARTMKEEFAVYGLPGWAMVLVGLLKLLFAAGLIAGIWIPALTIPSAAGIGVLMLGAVAMHFKVHDPPKKSLPAFTMFILYSSCDVGRSLAADRGRCMRSLVLAGRIQRGGVVLNVTWPGDTWPARLAGIATSRGQACLASRGSRVSVRGVIETPGSTDRIR